MPQTRRRPAPRACAPAFATLALLALAAAGCQTTISPEGAFACEGDGDCTAGTSCRGGICVTDEQLGDVSLPDGHGAPEARVLRERTCAKGACDDGNPCTTDGCEDAGGCTHGPDDSAACDDGDPCTPEDKCDKGVCVGAGEPVCECRKDADCAPKEDGDLCNGTLRCDTTSLPWSCTPDAATSVTCDQSGDPPCRVNTCNPKTGSCALVFRKDGAKCDDGDACTDEESCAGGTCVPAKDKPCDDGDACTVDTCDAKTGECASLPAKDGGACDDGDACTKDDACEAGACKGTAIKGCGG